MVPPEGCSTHAELTLEWPAEAVGICMRHGQVGNHQVPPELDGEVGKRLTDRLVLRSEREPAHEDAEAEVQQVRPGRAQARRVRRSEDQVAILVTSPFGAPLFSFEPLRVKIVPCPIRSLRLFSATP